MLPRSTVASPLVVAVVAAAASGGGREESVVRFVVSPVY